MSNKQRNCKYREYEVTVTEAPIFDDNAKTCTNSFVSANIKEIDFEELTNKVISNNPKEQVPIIIRYFKEW